MREGQAQAPVFLFLLLAIAAAARFLLQISQMPPYAGLDEIYHVARLAFVREAGRNPLSSEPSIPVYLERSIRQQSGQQPAFGVIGDRWPEVVASGARPAAVIPADLDRRPGTMTNYEAQHPSLYYTLAAYAAPRGRSDLADLRAWRLFSLPFAVIAALAIGWIGWRTSGPAGVLAAAVFITLPTWTTIVAKASNDALACALMAIAFAISYDAPRRRAGWILEGLAWAAALAGKLYAWPLSAVLPFLWWKQKAPRARWITVMSIGAAGFALTVFDLYQRTGNPLGLFAFDRVAEAAKPVATDWATAFKTIALTFAWTSGPHWNALTATGFALFMLPLIVLAVIGVIRTPRASLAIVWMTALLFAFAQSVKFAAYLRSARVEGLSLPAGGKEGWYWYTLAPVFAGVLLAVILRKRWIAVVFVAWVLFWDVMLTENSLFRDYRGVTSPAARSTLVRWGSSGRPGAGMAIGPWSGGAVVLRGMHVLALITVVSLARERRPERSNG